MMPVMTVMMILMMMMVLVVMIPMVVTIPMMVMVLVSVGGGGMPVAMGVEVLMVMEVEWGECVGMVVEVEDSALGAWW